MWWMSQARCMIHSIKYFREPFGLAPVEAQSCKCPVIAWKNGGCKETIPEYNLVSSFDELVNRIIIIKSMQPEAMSVMQQEVMEIAQQYSEERMVSRYEQLCFEAIETGGW